MRRQTLVPFLLALFCLAEAKADPSSKLAARFSLERLQEEPTQRARPSDTALTELKAAVEKDPRLRRPRIELVRGLLAAGKLEAARDEAQSFREHDAYNLVAVRLLGDIETELGDRASARRTYSSIVELLPKEVEARRALATVLKQAGDLDGARAQLALALELRPEDRRIAFELGDVEQRLNLLSEARERFESTANAPDADDGLRYPAKQRLAQIYGAERRAALTAGDGPRASDLEQKIAALAIQGGLENDMKVFLSWDTDRTDVDLWVLTPTGEKVFYGHPTGARGEALFHDVTTGYGPESFTAHDAAHGDYQIQVNYFGARSGDFKEARGEVIVVLDEGRPTEVSRTFHYRLFEQGQTVSVARVHVLGGAS
jgi:tetratricopeptide (TPR) repeat protein